MKFIDEITQEIVDRHGEKELCKYCIHEGDCSGGVVGGPNGPIYPPCADSKPEDWFDLDSYVEGRKEVLKIEKIVYNNPATIVWFADGEKITVKVHNEPFDKEKGVAMAIARKLYSRSEFVKLIESGHVQNQKTETARKTLCRTGRRGVIKCQK